MEKFSLPSLRHISGFKPLEIFKKIGLKSLATDFYMGIANDYGSLEKPYILIDSLKEKNMIRVITDDGYIEKVNIHNTSCGIRPILYFSKIRGIPTNDGKYKLIGDHTLEVEYGYYPQVCVSKNIIDRASISKKVFYKKPKISTSDLFNSSDNIPIYVLDGKGRTFIEYVVTHDSDLDVRKEVFELKPVKWFADLRENIMISEKTLDFGIPIVNHNQSKYLDKYFDKTYMYKFLNGVFAHNLEQFIDKVHYIDLKNLLYLIDCDKIEQSNIEYLKKQFKTDNTLGIKALINKEVVPHNISNKSIEEIKTNQETVSNKGQQSYFFNNCAVSMSGKFIQIIFDNQLYTLPLDNVIISDICLQDDVHFTYDFDNIIIRNDKIEEETFKLNNALKRAYINRLLRMNLNESIQEYIKKYDRYLEYDGLPSVTCIKTIVNELAYIYYKEYTSKYNSDIIKQQMKDINLDKGFDEQYYKRIKLVRYR